MERINQQYGTTMLMVTHNEAIKDMAHRVIFLKDGYVEETRINEHPLRAADVEC